MRPDWQIVLRTKVVTALCGFLDLWARDVSSAFFKSPCLVIAPHPDDETLGCGATIAQMRKAGRRVRIVTVTDGRASEEKSGLSPEDLAVRRKKEMLEACERLGVPPDDVVFLGYSDSEAGECIDAIQQDLQNEIRELSPRLILSPSPCDSNADHQAVAAALGNLSGEISRSVIVYDYIIWFTPFGYLLGILPLALSGRLRRVKTFAGQAAKVEAFNAHSSQYGGAEDARQMRKKLWSRFFRPYEIFVETKAS